MADERKVGPGTTLAVVLTQALPQLRQIAPAYVNLQKLMALAIEAQQRNPMLANCSQVSVLNFCKKCAEAGTDKVGAGGMWAVPFWNNKTNSYDMTPIPDWRLLIEKAKIARAITHASTDVVREGDFFEYSRGTDPKLEHKPLLGNTGKPLAAYCVYVLPDGSKDFVLMGWESEIIPIRNRSKAWQNYVKDNSKTCPWVTDEIEMGKKTVVKRAMKLFEAADPKLTLLLDADNVVNGFLDPQEEREPISMPKALSPNAPEPPQEGSGMTEGTGDIPPVPQEEHKSHSGVLTTVTKRSGKTNGKEWTRFGVNVGSEWFNTFDTKLAAEAEAFKGTTVGVSYDESPKGKILVSFVAPMVTTNPDAEFRPITPEEIEALAVYAHEHGLDLEALDELSVERFAVPSCKATKYQADKLREEIGEKT